MVNSQYYKKCIIGLDYKSAWFDLTNWTMCSQFLKLFALSISYLSLNLQAQVRAAVDRLERLSSNDVQAWDIRFSKSVCFIYTR